MKLVRQLLFLTILGAMIISMGLLTGGCSSDSDSTAKKPATEAEKRAEIQNILTETITRWRYGDKSSQYENEFPYLRLRVTYGEYLDLPNIKGVRADSIMALTLKDITFFDDDSAKADVRAMMVTSTNDTAYYTFTSPFYYYEGRWIRPTLSGREGQEKFNELRRKADSAAKAEQYETW